MTNSNTPTQDKTGYGMQALRVSLLHLIATLLLCGLPVFLSGSQAPTLLDRIKQNGYLPIISRNGPTTYYEGTYGFAGFEYELATAFADSLGVELVIHEDEDLGEMLNAVGTPVAEFAAAGLTITAERKKSLRFTQDYMTVTQQVIYRRGSDKPKTVDDLIGKDILVISDSSHAEHLRQLQQQYPQLSWREQPDVEMLDLLEMVHSGSIDIAIVDSNAFTANRSIYPRARVAFDISSPQQLAWAFPIQHDGTLYRAANAFLNSMAVGGQLAELQQKHFSDDDSVDESGALVLSKRIEQRLPKWKKNFQKAGKEYGIDWLFLAAISYQESHWNPDAKSPTGVRGMMMLTLRTASDMGVEDRTDPIQSIEGGAKYFKAVMRRLSDNILEPDRTWMALAAYNVGLGHLEDARKLTEQQQGNPNLWDDVRQRLPLLAKRKYYRQTKHGYARGWEPVRYVDNIRSFHNILVWHNQLQEKRIAEQNQDQNLQPVIYSRIVDNVTSKL